MTVSTHELKDSGALSAMPDFLALARSRLSRKGRCGSWSSVTSPRLGRHAHLPRAAAFAARYQQQPDLFQSFAVIFEGPRDLDKEGFERHFPEQVQSLADKDA